MATTDDALETYTHLPVQVDPQTKKVTVLSSDLSLQDAVENINRLHTAIKSLDTDIPPPPVPIKPQRSAQIQKLRDSATASVKKGQVAEALRFLTLAITMAESRPSWEPVGLVREELAICYMARANAHLLAQNWVEGWKDAECSTVCKRGPQTGPNGEKGPGNPRAFVIGGRCLIEMGKWSEALAWLERAVEIEGTEGEEGKELQRLLSQAKAEVNKSKPA